MIAAIIVLGGVVGWGVGAGVCLVVAAPQIESAGANSDSVYVCSFVLWPLVLPMLLTINRLRARAARSQLPPARVIQPTPPRQR
jgi:hypothetical protein